MRSRLFFCAMRRNVVSKDTPAKDFGGEAGDSRDAAERGREMGILRHSRYALKAPAGARSPVVFSGVCLTGRGDDECQPARDLRRLDREC